MAGITIKQHDDMPTPVVAQHLGWKVLELLSLLAPPNVEQSMPGLQVQALKHHVAETGAGASHLLPR